jgi:penicillin-binding protein 2
MAMSALLDGVITPQTSFFGAPTWTLPGTERHYRDWKNRPRYAGRHQSD